MLKGLNKIDSEPYDGIFHESKNILSFHMVYCACVIDQFKITFIHLVVEIAVLSKII